MMKHPHFSRREFIAGSGAMAAAGTFLQPDLARAAAALKGASAPRYSRIKLGDFDVTVLLDAQRAVEAPQNIFGMNVEAEEFEQVSKENFLPTDTSMFFFTPTIVNTGQELVLFDTGLGESGNIVDVLAEAGYTPDQVDVVVLTHMHPDHIGGVMIEDRVTFPNARYVAHETEFDFWRSQNGEGRVGGLFAKKVEPLAEKFSFLKDGGSAASGITAVACHGHTPGHTAFMIESDNSQIMLTADLANHYVWSLAYPDWEVKFDMDKSAAAASRRKILGMLATDRVPFIGFHMPFPAMGFVETRGDGFQYVPESYQLEL